MHDNDTIQEGLSLIPLVLSTCSDQTKKYALGQSIKIDEKQEEDEGLAEFFWRQSY